MEKKWLPTDTQIKEYLLKHWIPQGLKALTYESRDKEVVKFTAKKVVYKLSECCCHNLDEVCIPCFRKRMQELLQEIEES